MSGKLAILSPASNATSETFIQSHRALNQGEVVFYYGGLGELKLDGSGRIQNDVSKAFWRIWGSLFGKVKFDIRKSLKESFRKNNVGSLLIEYGTFAADLLPYLDFFDGRIIVHFHGYDASSFDVLANYKECYKDLFQRASSLVVVSKKMKAMLLEMGAPEEKLKLNTYGPHPDFFRISPSYESKQLVYVGRFVDKKAPYYLVLMMAELVKIIPDVKLVMIGEGALYQVVRDLIVYFNLEDKVILKGIQSREQISEIFSESACCVQHSVRALDGDMEGTPNSVLEASAAGLPVISTLHAGIPDVVLHNESGFLVEEHDVKSMTKSLVSLINSPDKLKKMGKIARENTLSNFSQKRYLGALDKIILGE